MGTSRGSTPGPELEPKPAIPASKDQALTTRFVDFWWLKVPAKLRRFSTLLWAVWSDGIYLTALPRLALVLVCVVFLFGFIEGGTHWSYRTIVGSNGFAGNVLAPMATGDNWGGPTRLVFAENLHLVIIAAVLGALSASLGLVLVIGYALGDFFVAGAKLPAMYSVASLSGPQIWVYRHVPLFVSYLLFFTLAALPTIMAQELVATAHPKIRHSRPLTIGLTAIVQALLVFGWSYMAPMVFRTVWLWPGGLPRIQVDFYSGMIMRWVLPFVFLVTIARGVLTKLAERSQSVEQRMTEIAGQATSIQSRFPGWGSALIRAAVITLLMTGFLHTPSNSVPGIMTNFVEAEIIFVCLALLLLAWIYIVPHMKLWNGWTARVNRYPVLLRLAAATFAGYVVSFFLTAIPAFRSERGGEFGPEVAGILIGFALTLALLPDGWFAEDQQEVPLSSGGRLPLPNSAAAQVASVIAIVLLASRRAFADCYDCHCCFHGCQPWTAGGSVAGSVPPLGRIGAGAKTPCADKKKAYDDAARERDRLAQVVASASKVVQQALDALSQAQNQFNESTNFELGLIIPDCCPNLSPPPGSPCHWSDAQLSPLLDGLAACAATTTCDPLFVRTAAQALERSWAELQFKGEQLANWEKYYNDAEQQYEEAEQKLADALKALQDCLAAHGLPLARPLGAPPPPKSQ
ncbi:MAG TPA: hypothetical protein VEI52_11150 [Terriglobales bacterium]|nr:hypothetical protein [Terriglobales bacterium]